MARGRVRNLNVENREAQADRVTPKMRELARDAYIGNVRKNQGTREETKARSELLLLMSDAGVSEFDSTPVIDGERVMLQTVYTPEGVGTASEVDVARLRELVSNEDFMRIVSASQKAVEEIAGPAVLAKCLTSVKVTKNPSVKVSPKKAKAETSRRGR